MQFEKHIKRSGRSKTAAPQRPDPKLAANEDDANDPDKEDVDKEGKDIINADKNTAKQIRQGNQLLVRANSIFLRVIDKGHRIKNPNSL